MQYLEVSCAVRPI